MAENPPDVTGIDLLLQVLRQRYPDRLSPETLEALRPDVEGILALSATLRTVQLDPHQEPFTQFKPYRSED